MIRNWLKPDWEPGQCISNIPIKYLLDKEIKAIILDVDKTILHGKDVIIHPSVIDWIIKAKCFLKIHLLSNNPSQKRIQSVAKQFELPFTYKAAKPRKKAIENVINQMKLRPEEISLIGDRIFTDVLAGNRLGLYTVLIRPIGIDGTPCKSNKIQSIEKAIVKYIGAT